MLVAVFVIAYTEIAFGGDDLEERLVKLEAIVAEQKILIETLQKDIEPITHYLTIDDEANIYLTGANLHIRSGSGTTNGEMNGLGNLIVGYNEKDELDIRTGSHNLVIGEQHSYSSFGGLVAGYNNKISGPYSSVSGGILGTASGSYSSVSGGISGTANREASSVSGGYNGKANGPYSSVSGGYNGVASGPYSSVSGGINEEADTQYSIAP